MLVDTAPIRQPFSRLRESLSELENNVAYVSKELPSLRIAASLRTQIAATCQRFDEALREARSQTGILQDAFSYDAPEIDPQAAMDAMSRRLGDAMDSMHRTVGAIEEGGSGDSGLALASILVTESATNMLRAMEGVKSSFRDLHQSLPGLRASPDKPRTAGHTFRCAMCPRVAGRVELLDAPSAFRIARRCFTSDMEGAVAPEWHDRVRKAVASGDIATLHQYDFELAAFYCPACNACYCGDHYHHWDVFEEDDGYVSHDCIRGQCPQGHERMLED